MPTCTWKRFSLSSAWLVVCFGAIGLNACGSSSGDDSSSGETGGSENVGGSANKGGNAGTTNKGGSAGTTNKGGSAGNAGSGNTAGSAGGNAGSGGKGGSAGSTNKGGGAGKGGGKADGGPSDAAADAKTDASREGGDATTPDASGGDAAAEVRYDFVTSSDIAGWAETSSTIPVETAWSATGYPNTPSDAGAAEGGTSSNGSLAVTFRMPEGGLLKADASVPDGGVDHLTASIVVTPSPTPAPGTTVTCQIYVPSGCKLEWIQLITAGDAWTNGTPTSWEGDWKACSITMPDGATASTSIGVQFGYKAGSNCTGKTVLIDQCAY